MPTSKQQQVVELSHQLETLNEEMAQERRAKHEAMVTAMTKGMSYDELSELRAVFNKRIQQQYADESDE